MNPLFSPLRLRGLELKNRIAVSPMQQYCTPEGLIGDWHLVHLGSRAIGGAGLIIAESTAVLPEGRSTTMDTGLWNEAQAASWQRVVNFVQEQGSKIAIQLGHCGSKGSRSHPTEGFQPRLPADGGWQTYSSSAITPFAGMASPKAMSLAEIEAVKAAFVAAAQRALAVGFDSIEIHAAHGYLFHQFYSELINQREDQYGGSFENRVRLLLETVAAIRAAIPDQVPLLLRISAVDYLDDPKAWQLSDTLRLAPLLHAQGVDLVTASAGGFVYLDKAKVFPNYQVPFASAIKETASVAVGAVGMITEAQQANQIIAEAQADLVVMAREFLRNPYFATNAALALGESPFLPIPYIRAY